MKATAEAKDALAGKGIVVTRARHQAAAWDHVIREFGAVPIAYPCIAMAPPLDAAAFNSCLRKLHEFDWLALSSGNAVRAAVDGARALSALPALGRMRIAALGPATAAELRGQMGRDADFMPGAYSAEALAREMPLGEGRRILLPQSDLADKGAAEILRARGGEVRAVVAYRTVIGSGGADVPALIERGAVDAVVFASPSAARYFRQRCSAPAALELPALCLGERTAHAAASEGFGCVIAPGTFGLRAMLMAFAAHCVRGDLGAGSGG